MDIEHVRELFDRQQRIEITYPGMAKEVLPHIVRFIRPKPGMSFILYSDLDEANADAVIDEQLAYFRRHALPFEWKVFGHDRPADLVQRLVARGLEAEEEDAIMVLDLTAAPEQLLSPPRSDARRLQDPAQLVDVVSILEDVWDSDFNWVHGRLGEHMSMPDYLSVYVAYVDGRPASAAWIYFSEGEFASLWGGSTVEQYRRRGLYTDLLAVRVQEARAMGKRYLTIDASDMSRPIVARHGFQLLTMATACEWSGPQQD